MVPDAAGGFVEHLGGHLLEALQAEVLRLGQPRHEIVWLLVQKRRCQLADDLLVTLHLHCGGGGGVIDVAALRLRHGRRMTRAVVHVECLVVVVVVGGRGRHGRRGHRRRAGVVGKGAGVGRRRAGGVAVVVRHHHHRRCRHGGLLLLLLEVLVVAVVPSSSTSTRASNHSVRGRRRHHDRWSSSACRRRCNRWRRQLQVEERMVAIDLTGHVVVGARGLERAAEGAEPEARAAVGLADLGHPLAPGPLADAAVRALLVVRPTLALHAPLARLAQSEASAATGSPAAAATAAAAAAAAVAGGAYLAAGGPAGG